MLLGIEPWESAKIGGSVPPIKTEIGWLLIYHGVAHDKQPFCYRADAALMDLGDPSKIIACLPYSLLEPETDYECVGDVNNVVFPQGVYLYDGYLYLSYGAADKRAALARCCHDELLLELKKFIKQ